MKSKTDKKMIIIYILLVIIIILLFFAFSKQCPDKTVLKGGTKEEYKRSIEALLNITIEQEEIIEDLRSNLSQDLS